MVQLCSEIRIWRKDNDPTAAGTELEKARARDRVQGRLVKAAETVADVLRYQVSTSPLRYACEYLAWFLLTLLLGRLALRPSWSEV